MLDNTDNYTSNTGSIGSLIVLTSIPGATNYMIATLSKWRASAYINQTSLATSGTSELKVSLYSKYGLYKLVLYQDNFSLEPISNVIDLQATAKGVAYTSSENAVISHDSVDGFGGFWAVTFSDKTLNNYLLEVMGWRFLTGSLSSTSFENIVYSPGELQIKWYKISGDSVFEITPTDMGTTRVSCTFSGTSATVEVPLMPLVIAWAPFNNIYYGVRPFRPVNADWCDINSMDIYTYYSDWNADMQGIYLFTLPDNSPAGVDAKERIYFKVNGAMKVIYDW